MQTRSYNFGLRLSHMFTKTITNAKRLLNSSFEEKKRILMVSVLRKIHFVLNHIEDVKNHERFEFHQY